MVFPDLGRDTFLPAGALTAVHLPALSAGDYPFCLRYEYGCMACCASPAKAVRILIAILDSDTDATIRETNNTTEVTDSHSNDRTAELNTLKKRFLVGVILVFPCLFWAWASCFGDTTSLPILHTPTTLGFRLFSPRLLCSYTGWDIHRIGWSALIHRNPEMNALVTVGTSAAYVFSMLVCIAPGDSSSNRSPRLFRHSCCCTSLFVVMGSLIESRARAGTNSAIEALMAPCALILHAFSAIPELKTEAWRLPQAGTQTPMSQIKTGDIVQVPGGHSVPADGVIVRGSARFDESMMTGESAAIERVIECYYGWHFES